MFEKFKNLSTKDKAWVLTPIITGLMFLGMVIAVLATGGFNWPF